MAPHSSTLAWKIPWTEEPGRLRSMGSLGPLSRTWLSDFTFIFHFHALEKEMATHSSVLAWRLPGMGEPGGLLSYRVAQSRTRLKRLRSSSSNISGGPSEIPTMPVPQAAKLVARPGWSKGTPKQTRRPTNWQYSWFSFRPVFWLFRRLSPDCTRWRDRPTHQEWPQEQVRPRGQSPVRSYPNR